MGAFFIDTQKGTVATLRQLIDAGVADETEPPGLPWHRLDGPGDASTMWYAILRRRSRGVFIGRLCLRHGPQHASLTQAGWQEVDVEEIGRGLPARPGADQAM